MGIFWSRNRSDSENTIPLTPTSGELEPSELTSGENLALLLTSRENQPSTRTSRENQPSPRTSRENQPSPRTSRENQPSPPTSRENQPSPRTSRENQPSTRTTRENQPSPRTSRENQPSPRTSRENQPSPRTSRENQPSPPTSRENQPSPRTSRENQPSGPTSGQKQPLSLVLLGENRVGKSSVGNAILGGKAFRIWRLFTKGCVKRKGKIKKGKKIKVVHTPGWTDFIHTTSEYNKGEIKHSVYYCSQGLIAFVLVVNADSKFNAAKRKAAEDHMELIGHSVWKHTVALLITKEENLNINDKVIEWLQRKCGNKCLVFNKKKKTEAAQVMKDLVDQAKIVAVQYDGEQNPMEEHRVMTEHNISEQQIMQGNGKKKNWLYKVRKSFAERVSKAVLSQLLNDLLEDGVLNEGEVESIEDEKSNLAKAFSFIDTVRKKGEKASEKLISQFQRRDPYFFEDIYPNVPQ